MPSTLPPGHDPDDDFRFQDDLNPADESDDEYDNPAFGEDDDYDDADSETVPCPDCRRPVYEDADYCPACGAAVVPNSQAPNRKVWIIAGVLLIAILAGSFLFL